MSKINEAITNSAMFVIQKSNNSLFIKNISRKLNLRITYMRIYPKKLIKHKNKR